MQSEFTSFVYIKVLQPIKESFSSVPNYDFKKRPFTFFELNIIF